VKTYIAALNASVERERERREQRARETVQQARERLAPVEDRLSRLLAAIPREVQSGGLSLPTAKRSAWPVAGFCPSRRPNAPTAVS
jgi:hypothetical protein